MAPGAGAGAGDAADADTVADAAADADTAAQAARAALLGWLGTLEEAVAAGDDPGADVALVFIAREDVSLDEDELHGALRRAMLLRATGGDPRRALDPEEHAVASLADDLDEPSCRRELVAALGDVAELVAGLPGLTAHAAALQAEPDRAWRLFALALLADHLDEAD